MRRCARLATLVVGFALALPTSALADPGTTTLHVVGHGRVFVTPDLATVSIIVNRSAATRELARGRTNRIIASMTSGLVRIGVQRQEIQTSAITLSTSTVRRNHVRRKVYDAEIDLTVTITRISLLSPVFEVASRAGADSYVGPNFGFSNPSAGLIDASAAALSDARRRADAAAAQLGMHVSGVQSVDLDPQSTPLPAAGAPGSSSAPTSLQSTTPVLPGRAEVDADVEVIYNLSS